MCVAHRVFIRYEKQTFYEGFYFIFRILFYICNHISEIPLFNLRLPLSTVVLVNYLYLQGELDTCCIWSQPLLILIYSFWVQLTFFKKLCKSDKVFLSQLSVQSYLLKYYYFFLHGPIFFLFSPGPAHYEILNTCSYQLVLCRSKKVETTYPTFFLDVPLLDNANLKIIIRCAKLDHPY